MAVYREGYDILKQYEAAKVQIWNDACDEGVLVNQGDRMWNNFKQLVQWYGEVKTRNQNGVNQVEIDVTLMDEWAVSDERKTVKEATEVYSVNYYKFAKREQTNSSMICKGYGGFFSITRKN